MNDFFAALGVDPAEPIPRIRSAEEGGADDDVDATAAGTIQLHRCTVPEEGEGGGTAGAAGVFTGANSWARRGWQRADQGSPRDRQRVRIDQRRMRVRVGGKRRGRDGAQVRDAMGNGARARRGAFPERARQDRQGGNGAAAVQAGVSAMVRAGGRCGRPNEARSCSSNEKVRRRRRDGGGDARKGQGPRARLRRRRGRDAEDLENRKV